jgi:uncharacterized membrane protein
MANDIQDRFGQILKSDSARALAGTAVSEGLKALSGQRSSNGAGAGGGESSRGNLSGVKGLAAGAGAAAMAPLAAKGIGKLIKGNGVGALAGGPKKLAEDATSKLGDTVEGKLKEKVDEKGGPSGILKDTLKSALPFGGGGGGGGSGKQDAEGVGKGRRMPVQQHYDIALPIETVYNQWTQFEEWPKFMHRVTRASQEDPCKVNFSVKIWGKTKEFTADIETQRPNDRIKWKTSQGMNHTGVVTFRELTPDLTRVTLSFDVAPGSLVEKYARGTRYVKRAARADLHRFVAFIEMLENETGAWRGVIEDGELVEDHDPSYDEQREYGSADELVHGRGAEQDEESDDEDDEEDDKDEPKGRNGGEPAQKPQRRARASSSSAKRGSSSRAQSRSGGSSSRSPGRSTSSGRSSSGNGGSSRSASKPSSGAASKRSSGSTRGRSSSSGKSAASSGGRSSGRSRSSGTSKSSRSSAGEHQGRQRSRASRRS